MDAEYMIDGQSLKLVDGVSEVQQLPRATGRSVSRYFGHDLRLDVDADGIDDIVFILTRETGGSGVYFYVVAALTTPDGIVGSHGLLLGDRIAPRSIEAGLPGTVTVNFAEREWGESFAVPPSIEQSLRLRFDPETRQFGEMVRDFEGEADPSRMSLDMHRWTWQKLTLADGSEESPIDATAFTLEFQDERRLIANTDCNVLAGNYVVDGTRLGIRALAATRMYCEGAQEAWFSALLRAAKGFRFTSKGELIILLGTDEGYMTFR